MPDVSPEVDFLRKMERVLKRERQYEAMGGARGVGDDGGEEVAESQA